MLGKTSLRASVFCIIVETYSQNFIFVSYRINLHISSCLKKKKKKKKKKEKTTKLHTSVNVVAYLCFRTLR